MNKKILAVLSLGASALPVLAEGDGNPLASVQTAMTGYVNTAQASVVAILTAGAVIVGSFFIWRVLKRALSSAK